MAMSKKHYESIAAIIQRELNIAEANENLDAISTAQSIAASLAGFFRQDNQQFDRSRFLRACGVKE